MRAFDAKAREPMRRCGLCAAALLVAVTLGLGPAPAGAQTATRRVPADMGEDHLEARARSQVEALGKSEVSSFFAFEDRRERSGITFQHRIVDDAGRDYKMVHYDHGNGVAVADVDGDGHQDLLFLTQLGSNELWRNLGGGRFENITEGSGVALADRVSVAAAFADYDNDGDADLFLTAVRAGNVLLRNDGRGRFTDVTRAAGVAYQGHSSGAVFFDYDLDGHLDLFVANVGTYTTDTKGRGGYYVGVDQAFSGHLFAERTEASLLYHNRGDGTFAEVSQTTGLADTSWSGDAAFADLDADRYPELYVLNMQGDDHFYRNRGGKRFEDDSAATFPRTPWGSMGIQFLDFDNDGDLDLALSDMHSDMSEDIGPERESLKSRMRWPEEQLQGGDNNIFGNAFYVNQGERGFVERSDELGTENYWPWGISAGDLNADGYSDLLLTSSMNYPFRYGVNSVLLNDRGKRFLPAEFALGVEPRERRVTAWFEVDCDAEPRHQDCGEHRGALQVLAAEGSRSAVIFDLDEDGDLDIVTSEFNSRPQVLVSDLADQGEISFLELRLAGRASNRDGLGSLVTVRSGDHSQTRWVDGKSGYLSQSSLPLYFGLPGGRADEIIVRWPSGTVQRRTEGIPRNGLLVLTEE